MPVIHFAGLDTGRAFTAPTGITNAGVAEVVVAQETLDAQQGMLYRVSLDQPKNRHERRAEAARARRGR